MPAGLSLQDLNQMSTEEKIQAIQNVKSETEALKQRIIYTKNQAMDASLPQIAQHTPSLGELKIRGRSKFKGHVGKVYSMKLTSDDQYLVSAAQDGFVLVWDALTTAKAEAIQLVNSWVLSCGTSPDNRIIATGGLDNACTLYPFFEEERDDSPTKVRNSQIKPRTPYAILKGHKGYISQIDFLDNSKLVTSSGDMTFATWDVETGERLQEYSDHLGDVNDFSQSPADVNIISTASADNTVKIWDIRIAPSRSVQTFTAQTTEVSAIHFFPDGNAVGTGCEDGTCRIYDLRSDCQLGMYKEPDELNSPVSSVRFTPSGRLLLTGYQDGSCGAWDILKATWIAQSPGHSAAVTSVKVSSDGHRLYSSSWDSTLRAWEP